MSTAPVLCEAGSELVPSIDPTRAALLTAAGITISALAPLGAEVTGMDLKVPQEEVVLAALEVEMAGRGFLVFKGQGVMAPDEQVRASELWGGRTIQSTHGVHSATPDSNKHIFRLSNHPQHGTLGVGPQWHNDGSFLSGTFSHVGYHIIKAAENGGGTYFAHQGAAFDRLPPTEQERWQRMVSVNSNSGVLHPLVHAHPISGRKSVWLHLGMTGAIIERVPAEGRLRLLDEAEMRKLFNDYNDLLNSGVKAGFTTNYEYQAGDLVIIDNFAVGHRAAPEAHMPVAQQGLRILHRTTVKAMADFKHPDLPQAVDIFGENPLGEGVWIGGGIGFRWDDAIHMQN
jgi:taurine dioxygenase